MVASFSPGPCSAGLMDAPFLNPHPVAPPIFLLNTLPSICGEGVIIPCPFLQTWWDISGTFLCPDFCWLQSGERHSSAGWGRLIAWTPVAPTSSKIGCRQILLHFTRTTIMRFTLFLQLPTPIPDLVSHKHEECIYEYHCFEDEKTGPAKRGGTLIQPLYYPNQPLCCTALL